MTNPTKQPVVGVEVRSKLHSEYRSTFQWHEYVGSKTNAAAGISHAVVRQPVQSSKTQAFWSGGQAGGGEERRGGKRVHIANVNNAVVNEWWLKKSSSNANTTPRPPSQAQIRGHSKFETQLPSEESGAPRKSMSMGAIRALDSTIPQTHQFTHHNTSQDNNAEAVVSRTEPRINMDTARGPDSLEWSEHRGTRENMSSSYEVPKTSQSDDTRLKRKEYKSEYKKQFRPFSQYEYVDGKFFKKRGDQEMGVNPWYKEVIELRQKAGEYRYRGWGTEFLPEVYHQNVWDQVSKQPSLAALALIQTTTRKPISKEEKEKENARKSLPKRSLSRPNTATPKHPLSESKMKDSEAVQGAKKKYDGPPSTASGRASRGTARSQSAGPGGRSPRKTMTHHSVLSKEREILDPNKPAPRHPRPTTLATSPRPKASSDKGHRLDVNSKLVKTLQFNQSSADPSLGFSEPVIKSPPEPTRVKSPEQVILRSPDPVNWTVPLDTTKSFTVTQNIRDAPPSPRFRAGDRLHGLDQSRSGPVSGVQSSSASTKTSSPSISSFSPRSSALAQKPKSAPTTKPTPSPPITGPQKQSGKSVLTGEKKANESKPMKSSPFNLNGNESTKSGIRTTVKSPPPKLDNQKPDDSTNNNERRPLGGTSTFQQPKPLAPKPVEVNLRKPIPGSTLKCLEDPQFMFDPPKGAPYLSKTQPQPPSVPIAGTHGKVTSPPNPTSPPVPAPRGAIRVLEAPQPALPPTGFVPPAPVSVSSTGKRSGMGSSQVSDSLPPATSPPSQSQPSKLPSYKVLDAPDPTEMYKSTMNPSTLTSTTGVAGLPPTTTSASAALSTSSTSSGSGSGGKSKHKFDFKFWGKNKDSEK